jgi:hypothetical protein
MTDKPKITMFGPGYHFEAHGFDDLRAQIETQGKCPVCNGCDWICDGDHPDRPWADQPGSGPNACGCGAGKPCPECNPLSKERRA